MAPTQTRKLALRKSDDGAVRPLEAEQRDARPEEHQRREDDHRGDERAKREVAMTAPNVLLSVTVVAQEPPAVLAAFTPRTGIRSIPTNARTVKERG